MPPTRSHDPFAPHRGGTPRPRRSTAEVELPGWLFDELRQRGVPEAAFALLAGQFEQLNGGERATALAELQQHRRNKGEMDELAAALTEYVERRAAADVDEPMDDDEAAAHAIERWHEHMTEAGDDDAAQLAAVSLLVEISKWLDEQPDPTASWYEIDELLGGDGPHRVAVYDAAIGRGLSFDEAMELAYPSPEPATGPQSDADAESGDSTGDGSEPASDSHSSSGVLSSDVPKNARDVIAWIGDAANDDERYDRAHAALLAELSYPSMRGSVRQTLDLVIGEATVQAAVDARG